MKNVTVVTHSRQISLSVGFEGDKDTSYSNFAR
jgi:hypothetical protein